MKNSTIKLIVTCVLFLVSMFTYCQKAGQTYLIRSDANDDYLEVQGSERWSPLEVKNHSGAAEQQFQLVDAGDGYFYIKSKTGRALHVQDNNKNPGAHVNLWEIVDQDNLKWKFINLERNLFIIQSKMGTTHLEVLPGGRLVRMGIDEDSPGSRWKLEPAVDLASKNNERNIDVSSLSNTSYYIESALGTFLDVKEGNTSVRTPIWMWKQTENEGQKWKLTETGDGYFYIQSGLGTYLDIKESNSGLRAHVWTWSNNGGKGQKWRFESTEDGYLYIQSALGTYLDIKEGNPDTRASVWMWKKNGGKGQKWKLRPIGTNEEVTDYASIVQGNYFIKSALGQRYLDIKDANPDTRAGIWTWYFSGGNGQKWNIVATGDNDNSYYIKSGLGKYLDIKESNSSPKAQVWTWYKNESDGQKWYFERTNTKDKFYIKSKLGTYLDVKQANSRVGAWVWMWSLNKGKGQHWTLVKPIETISKANPKFTSFDVNSDGFQFTNQFKTIVDLGLKKITLKGLCGGMAYAANDFFLNNVRIPSADTLPPDGSPLQKYIYDRQQSSFENLDKFTELTVNPFGERDEEFFYWGLEGRFYNQLKNSIDSNKPIPLGLFNIHNNPGTHHQVLAIGYDFGGYREGRHFDPNKNKVRFFIYDPNYKNEICVLVPNVSERCYDEYKVSKQDGYAIKSNNKKSKKWRTYFVDEKYKLKVPPSILIQ